MPGDLAVAGQVTRSFFSHGRWRIAQELAQHWQWRTDHGQFKTRAALAIWVAWEQRGYRPWPPALIPHGARRSPGALAPTPARGPSLRGALADDQPRPWTRVRSAEQRRHGRALLAQHPPRGAPGLVGAHLEYFFSGAGGDLLGALGWPSAVERLDGRDRLIGVNRQPAGRAQFPAPAVNQARWLI
jgi:hypothetical protein